MRCRLHVSAKAHPHTLLYHYAGHAVAMDHFDIPTISVRVDARARSGAIYALMEHRDTRGSRMVVERDVVAAYAGLEAERRGCGGGSWFGALDDCRTASKRLTRFTPDTAERAAWEIYLGMRARVVVRALWDEITILAAVLQRERILNRANVAATLKAFRADPYRRDLQPLPPVAWSRPTRDAAAGPDEVELVWKKPTLSALLAEVHR